jgi:hypothetical protein
MNVTPTGTPIAMNRSNKPIMIQPTVKTSILASPQECRYR